MITQTSFQERIDDKTKTPIVPDFISSIRSIAVANSLSEDEIYAKWRSHCDWCKYADQSPTLSEFCVCNYLIMVE